MAKPVTLKKYTHIFFDLDNTLWDFERNSRNAMFEAFGIFRLEPVINFDQFFSIYLKHNHALWDLYRKNEIGKKELTRLRFENTFNELSVKGVDPEEMNTCYLDVMPKQKVLYEGVSELLEFLKAKKYHLFIITNGFKEVQLKKLESSGLKQYFTKIFISEEIKTPKPGRRIFEYAVKSANAKKLKSLMIGDDWEVDVLGAVNFGIDAVHFTNDCKSECEKLIGETSSRAIFQTGSLQKLISCF